MRTCLALPVATTAIVAQVMGEEGEQREPKRFSSASMTGRWSAGCVVGCFSKSASPGVPVAGSKGTLVVSGRTSRHFLFTETGFLGIELISGRYPFEVGKVDVGSAAEYRGVPEKSIIWRVNGRKLSASDSEETKESVREELKARPLSFDVVLQCAAGVRSLSGGLPGVPGKAGVAGADAGAGAGRGTLVELISSLSEEEREIVGCVLRKLHNERSQRYQVVYAVLCELAGVTRKRSQCSKQCESTRKKRTYIEAG